MGSVIFDFDSTLVPEESLEAVLAQSEGLDPDQVAEIAHITVEGMEGRISFEESLRSRLAIASPDLDAVRSVGRKLAAAPSRGAALLVAALHAKGHEVWIVSGGLQEILVDVGIALGIPESRIHGVAGRWNPDGTLDVLEPDSGFNVSKVEGIRRLGIGFERPAVGVGDGATDLALREAGFVDRFVAYTEHARRESVVDRADATAANMQDLGGVLANLLA